jgi:hypothetical protein
VAVGSGWRGVFDTRIFKVLDFKHCFDKFMNRTNLVLVGALVLVILIGGVFWLQFMKSKQMAQNTESTTKVGSTETPNNTHQSDCDADKSQEFKGKYYSFRYPCQYALHVNSSDDRKVSFGSPDYFALYYEKNDGLTNSPQGYIVTVSYSKFESLGSTWGKNIQEQWLNWMGRSMGSIGKTEFSGITTLEDGKTVYKSLVKGYGFMDEFEEKQINIRIGVHNGDYTKSAEIEMLTPERI